MIKNVRVIAKASFVQQTTKFTSRALFVATEDGDYRLSIYADVTNNPGAAGSIYADVHWTDDQENEEVFTQTLPYAANGPFYAQQSIVLRLAAGTSLTIAGAGDNAPSGSTYSMFFTLEEL